MNRGDLAVYLKIGARIMSDFSGKSVLVTGAGTGIGWATCKHFAKAGAWVALNDIQLDLAESAASKINAELGADRVVPYACDVADVAAVRAMISHFAALHDRLDVVVANAGLTSFGAFLDYAPENFDRIVAVNLRGSFFTAQAGAQEMIARGIAGRIILTSSVTGVQAYPNLSAYGMTKAAIQFMAKIMAVELGSYKITVNTITPGAVATERTLKDEPDYEAHWGKLTPTRRSSTVDDIAAATMFFASPEAAQLTGQNLILDGGWTLTSPIPE